MSGGLNRAEAYFFKTVLLFLVCISWIPAFAQQLFINEVQSSNVSTLYDFSEETPDWIEIFNAGNQTVDLEGYGLTDVDSIPLKWVFPSILIQPKSHLLVYASGLDIKNPGLYWGTIADVGDIWSYTLPKSALTDDWKKPGFNDVDWKTDKSGFGYGDSDDSTQVESTISLFIRKKFTLTDKAEILQAYLHIDYDDGFVAWLNGVEIARSSIGEVGENTAFDQSANPDGHEAKLYQGGEMESFLIDSAFQYLQVGENVLAIQIHNSGLFSSDMSAIPVFTLGHKNPPENPQEISKYINLRPIGLHTNFKISSEAEQITLSTPNGQPIDVISTGFIPADISLGRKPDGSNSWRFFNKPTPGASNQTQSYTRSMLDSVHFSLKGGFYTTSINLSLTGTNVNDSIFYTLDGSDPSKTDSLFTTSISISNTTAIRARILRHDYLPGATSTNTYLINPSKALPIVTITTDPGNLWDNETGIYVKGSDAETQLPYFGANFWQDWERPAHVAMYEPDGSLAFQLDVGIKIFGNWSRANDQKSLVIHARKRYGNDKISYKIFDEKSIDEFESIVLRNSGNDFNSTMFRDALNNAIVKDLQLDHQAYRPAVVYINGKYWGIQNIREKINEAFLAANHDIDKKDIDIQENTQYITTSTSEHYENLLDFVKNNSLANNQNYDYVQTQIDVQNFMKYQIAEIFIDNRDWPGNNIKYWREQIPGSKWRWIFFDTDFGLNIWSKENQSFNTLQFALKANGPNWPNPPWSTLLFRKLTENQQFKNAFINCFADQLNTIFKSEVTIRKLNEMKAGIEGEIDAHLARWNGDKWYWNDRIKSMEMFLNERSGFVRNHISGVFNLSGVYNISMDVSGSGMLKVNTLFLNTFPWSGYYYKNIPIEIEAVPAPGYRFVKWEGIDTMAKEKLKLDANAATSLTAIFEPVQSTPGEIVINEINYNSAEDFVPGDWVELKNISDHAINISGWTIRDNNDDHTFVMPENTVIASHGFLVVCKDKVKFGAVFPLVSTVAGEMDFGLSSSEDCVRLFDIDGKLADEVCYKGSDPWPVKANGGGSSLSLLDASSNNGHPANWEASFGPGTPGKQNDIITSVEVESTYQIASHIYPNPTDQFFKVKIYAQSQEKLKISLVDLSGKEIQLWPDVNLIQGNNQIELEFGKNMLVPGIYIIKLNSITRQENIKLLKK